VRLFVGIPIEGALEEAVGAIGHAARTAVERAAPDCRLTWVRPGRLHITLRFIGEVAETSFGSIERALAVALPLAPFDVPLGRPCLAPPKGRPRGIWLEVLDGGQLSVLARLVGERLESVSGLRAGEQVFRPHVTLARVREGSRLLLGAALDRLPVRSPGSLRVDAITLCESRLSPAGPTYVPRQRTRLDPTAAPHRRA
jgi:2'-5' RNA ligase